MNYSKTQLENIVKVIGFVLMYTGHEVNNDAISGFITVLGAFIGLGATAISYIRRFLRGDVTFGGFKK